MEYILCFCMLFEVCSACYVIFGCKFSKITKTKVILILLLFLIYYVLTNIWAGIYAIQIVMVSFIFIQIVYEDKFIYKFKIWIISVLVTALLEAVPSYLLRVLGILETHLGICCSVSAILFLWIYYFLIGRKLSKEPFKFSLKVWLIIIVILSLLILMVYFSVFSLLLLEDKQIQNIFIILLGGGITAIFLLFVVLIYYLCSTYKYQVQSEIMEKFNKQQKEYYKHLLEIEEETRKFRHDIKNQLLEIRVFCDNGNIEEACSYVNVLLNDVLDIGKQYDVGNAVINTMLNYYLCMVEKQCDIYVNGLVSDDIAIENVDLCIIVSNLVKNAVEAIMKLEGSNKEIYFMAKQSKQYIYIQVKNTVDIEKIVKNNNKIVTTKMDKDNHGFGLENIKRVVEKYAGEYNIEIENGYFITEITIEM